MASLSCVYEMFLGYLKQTTAKKVQVAYEVTIVLEVAVSECIHHQLTIVQERASVVCYLMQYWHNGCGHIVNHIQGLLVIL